MQPAPGAAFELGMGCGHGAVGIFGGAAGGTAVFLFVHGADEAHARAVGGFGVGAFDEMFQVLGHGVSADVRAAAVSGRAPCGVSPNQQRCATTTHRKGAVGLRHACTIVAVNKSSKQKISFAAGSI